MPAGDSPFCYDESMTDLEQMDWTAMCTLEYPPETVIAWENIANVLFENLRGRGPILRYHPEGTALIAAFALEAATQEEATEQSTSMIRSILGDQVPIRDIRVMSWAEMQAELDQMTELERKRREKEARTMVADRYRTTPKPPQPAQPSQEAEVRQFTPRPKEIEPSE